MYYTIKASNNKGADQTARMRRLIYIFVVRIWQKKKGFLMTWLKYSLQEKRDTHTVLSHSPDLCPIKHRVTLPDATGSIGEWLSFGRVSSNDSDRYFTLFHGCRIYTSHVMRKAVFGACDQVRLKPACSASETS